MKKNLRIVSAAAAALLAVAPVAAAAVAPASTVFAADWTVPGVVVLTRNSNDALTAKLNDTQKAAILAHFGLSSNDFDLDATVSSADRPNNTTGEFTQKLTVNFKLKNGANLPSLDSNLRTKLGVPTDTAVSSTAAGTYYNLGIDSKGNLALKKITVPAGGTAPTSADWSNSAKYTTEALTLPDNVQVTARYASQQGTPYFYYKNITANGAKANQVIADGSTIDLLNQTNSFSAQDLLDAINEKIGAKTSDSANNSATITNTRANIEDQLVADGLKRLSNGDFDFPQSAFKLSLTAESDNGKKTTITVWVNANAVNYNAPFFTVGKDSKTLVGNGSVVSLSNAGDYKVALNGKFDVDEFLADVTAYVQNVNKSTTTLDPAFNEQKLALSKDSVDSSKVNTAVAGYYPVVVRATNPAGLTSKITVMVKVGDPDATYMFAKEDAAEVTINGNTVSPYSVNNAAQVLKKGTKVATFGAVTVNGVSYTRLNSKDSKVFVATSSLTATDPNAATTNNNESTKNVTIMHIAAVYTKNGVKTTERLRAYDSASVVAEPVTLKDASGKEIAGKFYKLAGQDKYIKVSNVDGSMKTLKHNSYVYTQYGKKAYKKNGKAVKLTKKVKRSTLRKEAAGSQVKVYGGALFNKQYYRIGKNQYIKVANFR